MARPRRRRKKKTSGFESLILIMAAFIGALVNLVFRLLLLLFDLITIYSTSYKQKSGNGFFKTFFNKGNYGEFILYRKIYKKFGKENVFVNVYLENINTDNTEVDIVALSNRGVYVFEMKNYSGYIYGSEKDQNWTQTFNRNSKFQFYNPLRQNYAHTKAIQNYLDIEYEKAIPLIVFSNNSKLKKLNVGDNHNIIYLKSVNRFIKTINKNNEQIFTPEQLNEFRSKLLIKTNVSQEIKDTHIEQVQKLKTNKLSEAKHAATFSDETNNYPNIDYNSKDSENDLKI